MTQVSVKAVQLCGFGRVVEAFDLKRPMTPSKLHGTRDPEVLKDAIRFNGLGDHPLTKVILVDDVLTLGTHFRAYKDVLVHKGGIAPRDVLGVFLSRHMFGGPNANSSGYHYTG